MHLRHCSVDSVEKRPASGNVGSATANDRGDAAATIPATSETGSNTSDNNTNNNISNNNQTSAAVTTPMNAAASLISSPVGAITIAAATSTSSFRRQNDSGGSLAESDRLDYAAASTGGYDNYDDAAANVDEHRKRRVTWDLRRSKPSPTRPADEIETDSTAVASPLDSEKKLARKLQTNQGHSYNHGADGATADPNDSETVAAAATATGGFFNHPRSLYSAVPGKGAGVGHFQTAGAIAELKDSASSLIHLSTAANSADGGQCTFDGFVPVDQHDEETVAARTCRQGRRESSLMCEAFEQQYQNHQQHDDNDLGTYFNGDSLSNQLHFGATKDYLSQQAPVPMNLFADYHMPPIQEQLTSISEHYHNSNHGQHQHQHQPVATAAIAAVASDWGSLNQQHHQTGSNIAYSNNNDTNTNSDSVDGNNIDVAGISDGGQYFEPCFGMPSQAQGQRRSVVEILNHHSHHPHLNHGQQHNASDNGNSYLSRGIVRHGAHHQYQRHHQQQEIVDRNEGGEHMSRNDGPSSRLQEPTSHHRHQTLNNGAYRAEQPTSNSDDDDPSSPSESPNQKVNGHQEHHKQQERRESHLYYATSSHHNTLHQHLVASSSNTDDNNNLIMTNSSGQIDCQESSSCIQRHHHKQQQHLPVEQPSPADSIGSVFCQPIETQGNSSSNIIRSHQSHHLHETQHVQSHHHDQLNNDNHHQRRFSAVAQNQVGSKYDYVSQLHPEYQPLAAQQDSRCSQYGCLIEHHSSMPSDAGFVSNAYTLQQANYFHEPFEMGPNSHHFHHQRQQQHDQDVTMENNFTDSDVTSNGKTYLLLGQDNSGSQSQVQHNTAPVTGHGYEGHYSPPAEHRQEKFVYKQGSTSNMIEPQPQQQSTSAAAYYAMTVPNNSISNNADQLATEQETNNYQQSSSMTNNVPLVSRLYDPNEEISGCLIDCQDIDCTSNDDRSSQSTSSDYQPRRSAIKIATNYGPTHLDKTTTPRCSQETIDKLRKFVEHRMKARNLTQPASEQMVAANDTSLSPHISSAATATAAGNKTAEAEKQSYKSSSSSSCLVTSNQQRSSSSSMYLTTRSGRQIRTSESVGIVEPARVQSNSGLINATNKASSLCSGSSSSSLDEHSGERATISNPCNIDNKTSSSTTNDSQHIRKFEVNCQPVSLETENRRLRSRTIVISPTNRNNATLSMDTSGATNTGDDNSYFAASCKLERARAILESTNNNRNSWSNFQSS